MFGGPAGLAAGASLTAVAFSMLLPHLEKAGRALGLLGEDTAKATDEVGKLNERIAELEKKPVKLAVDMLELDNAKEKLAQLKKDQAIFNALKEGKTVFQKEAGDQFKQNFEDLGEEGHKASEDVRRQIEKELLAQSETLRTKLRGAQARAQKEQDAAERRIQHATTGADAQQAVDAMERAKAKVASAKNEADKAELAAHDEAEQKTGAMFGGAFAGNNKAARDQLIKRLTAAGHGNIARGLAVSTPEEMEAQSDIENKFDRKDAAAKAARAHARQIDQQAAHNFANDPDAQRERDDRLKNLARAPMAPEMAAKSLGVDPEVYEKELREGKALLAKEIAKAQHADKADLPMAPEKLHDARRSRDEEQLARQIYAGSQQATGVQFTPEQARSTAKATADAIGKGVSFNAALQIALQHEVQAMAMLATQLDSQQQQVQQLGFGFQGILQQLRMQQARQRNGQKRGG